MRKIIIIGPAYPLRGGLATFNERLARAFQSEGYEVIIYTFSLQYPSILFPGKTQFSESAPPQDLNIKVEINSINPLNWWRMGRKIRNEKADKVMIRYWLPFLGPCLGTIARFIQKSNDTEVIALVDNAIPHEKRIGDHTFSTYFVNSVDRFVTMSQKVADDLRTFSDKEITVTNHPLYDNFENRVTKTEARKLLDIDANDYVFLFFGFIRKYKGLDLLVEAFNEMDFKGRNCKLLIAGEFYAGEDDIKQQIVSSPRTKDILCHTKFIKDEEVYQYFCAADAVIQPYRMATQSGVTPLAYHFEVPMMVTRVGALPDMVPPSIGIITEPDVTSIAKGLEDMFDFDTEIFAKSIVEEKKKYSWSILTNIISGNVDHS